jgi:hypothetical protein
MHGSDYYLCFAYIMAKVESDPITMAIFEDLITFGHAKEV